MDDDDKKVFYAGMVALPAVFLVIPLIVLPFLLVRAFVFGQIWNWWVAPTFGQPMLTLPMSLVIVLMVNLLTPYTESKKNLQELITGSLWRALGELVVLLMAWIALAFV